MKTKCLIPTRYLVAASLILLAVLVTCYDVGANLRRGSERRESKGPDIFRTENDDDPEYREQRREFLKRFFGNREGGVSRCDSGVYKTTDMGTSWTQYGIPNLIYRDVAIDPSNPNRIFAASNAGVFASTDGGLTWGNVSEGIPAGVMVSALSFNAARRQLAASTYGRGVYVFNFGRSTPRPRR